MSLPFAIDGDFPGGNVILEGVEANTVFVRQDLRDTEGHWFYWSFRVRGAADRTLTFKFTQGNVVGVHGPAVSDDAGVTWRWLGGDHATTSGFTYTFAEADVRFSVTIPYLETNLQRFLAGYEGNPHLRVEALCKSQHGRTIERLHLGKLNGVPEHRVFIACRHHACESMASFALEGIMAAVLADTAIGAWFCERAEVLVVPFVDKDGVEEGDQGKNRRPYDHNRDYEGESIYPSTRAIRELLPQWSGGKLRFTLDMHCPGLRGSGHEYIYFVGGLDKEDWVRLEYFSDLLEAVQSGSLVFSKQNNLPYGQGWNTSPDRHVSFDGWSGKLPGVRLGTIVEVPYANASGQVVTPETARAFGYDLARAIYRFLQEAPAKESQ